MDTRLQLVEEWKAKLEANSHPPDENGERFAWIRQVYTRIYRFLISCYGEGEWRADDDASSLNTDSWSTASRMPFVEEVSTSDGLLPKSPERIRAALESIHGHNPGIATPGTTVGVEEDTWVVAAAQKKAKFARTIRRRLVACGIEARLLNRTTDIAVVVRYKDFQEAVTVVQAIGPPTRIGLHPLFSVWSMEPIDEKVGRSREIRISKGVDPRRAVGTFVLIATVFTFLEIALTTDAMQPNVVFALCGLWIAALAFGWLYGRGRTIR